MLFIGDCEGICLVLWECSARSSPFMSRLQELFADRFQVFLDKYGLASIFCVVGCGSITCDVWDMGCL